MDPEEDKDLMWIAAEGVNTSITSSYKHLYLNHGKHNRIQRKKLSTSIKTQERQWKNIL
jgi:hypothetical protein